MSLKPAHVTTFLFSALMIAFAFVCLAQPEIVSAATNSVLKQDACAGVAQIGGSGCANGGAAATSTVGSIVSKIVTLLSVVVGIAAVIMIILAGFKYITSGGDSSKVSSAKSTLIYALVGVVIVALAQFIVKFVLDRV